MGAGLTGAHHAHPELWRHCQLEAAPHAAVGLEGAGRSVTREADVYAQAHGQGLQVGVTYGHKGSIMCMQYGHVGTDQRLLVTGSADRTVKVRSCTHMCALS